MNHARRVSSLALLASLACSVTACGGTSDPGVGHDPANPGGGSGSGTTNGGSGGAANGSGDSTSSGSGTTSGSGSGGSSGSGTSGSGSSGTQKGPIRLQNVSYTKPSTNHLVVTFTVTNTGNERLEQVDLANIGLAGSAIDFRFTSCPATDPAYVWSLLPGETSDILTVDLYASSGGAEIAYPCTFTDPQVTATSTTSWPALSGSVTLTLKGLMSDASPWTAVGTGDER